MPGPSTSGCWPSPAPAVIPLTHIGSCPSKFGAAYCAERCLFNPRAVIAIGDHVYWDQRTELYNRGEEWGRKTRKIYETVGWLELAQPVLGTQNEASLKAAVWPQIGQLYGTMLRSTPSYFVSDDHDYFENDDADERMVTFPPDHYQLELARLTRLWYLPEFLPDRAGHSPYREPAPVIGLPASPKLLAHYDMAVW